MDLNIESSDRNPLWPVLVEVVHELLMYKNHKEYIFELLDKQPNLSAEEISVRLRIPLGEALVILKELKDERESR